MRTIDQQMREMLQMPGVRSVRLVDWRRGRVHAGVGAKDCFSDTAEMLHAIHGGPLCAFGALEDVVVTEADHHLLFAVVKDSDLCVQVWMGREEGNLGIALRLLRGLASTAGPPPRDYGDHPPRCDGDWPRPPARAAVPVDRSVLERVLAALRTLSVGRLRSETVIA